MGKPLEQSSNGNSQGNIFHESGAGSSRFDAPRFDFTNRDLSTFPLPETSRSHTMSQDTVIGAVRTLKRHNIQISHEALSTFLDGQISAKDRSTKKQENLQDPLGSKICSRLKACLETGLSEVFRAEPSISRKIGNKAVENLSWELAKMYPTDATDNQRLLLSQLVHTFQSGVERLINNQGNHYSRERMYKDIQKDLEKTIEKLSQIYVEKYFKVHFSSFLEEKGIPRIDDLSDIKRTKPVEYVKYAYGEDVARVFILAKAKTNYKRAEQMQSNIDTIRQFHKRYKYKIIKKSEGIIEIEITINGVLCYDNIMDVPNRTLTALINDRHEDEEMKLPGSSALPNYELLWNVQRIAIYAITGEDISKDTFATTVHRQAISNRETMAIVELFAPDFQGDENGPLESFSPKPKSDAFVSIMGAAPNCLGQLYQLKQHEDVIGKEEITFLRASKYFPGGIEMRIGDTQNQEQVNISPERWRLDEETLESMARSFFEEKIRSTTAFHLQ